MIPRTASTVGPRIPTTVAKSLGAAILSGTYPEGHLFPGEVEHAAQLKISRTAYREAIRILASKGLLESRPKWGTRVNEREQWLLLDPDVLAWMFEGEPTEEFVLDLFELRGMIEPAAAGFAAARRDRRQLERMRTALNGMRVHGFRTVEGQNADQDFHRTILEATGNETVKVLGASVGAAVAWTTEFKRRQGEWDRDPFEDHSRVFDAIAASDVRGARRAMKELVDLALEDMGLKGTGQATRRSR